MSKEAPTRIHLKEGWWLEDWPRSDRYLHVHCPDTRIPPTLHRDIAAVLLEAQGKHTPVSREEIVEAMAEAAHEAWMAAHRDQGVESRRAPWGEEFMVPYSDLSQQGREFDRVIMRAILDAFDLVGLTVVRKEEG